jgi:hypothetical protein
MFVSNKRKISDLVLDHRSFIELAACSVVVAVLPHLSKN